MLSLDSNSNQSSTFIPLNASSLFEPLKMEVYLDGDEEECLRCESFLNLVTEQMNQNKPYMLALLQDVGLRLWGKAMYIYAHPEVSYHIGLNYWEGKGVQKDRQIAAFYFYDAKELGQKEAEDKFIQWELEASDREKGQTYCLIALGCCDYTEQKWLHLAIGNKNSDALFLLAKFYYLGCRDFTKATDVKDGYKVKLLEMMKLDINPNFEEILKSEKVYSSKTQEELEITRTLNQFLIGMIYYEFGEKTRDANKIIKWLKLAAKKGHAKAQYQLGFCYYYGDCVAQNAKEGLKWLKLSAKQDNVDAKIFLNRIQILK